MKYIKPADRRKALKLEAIKKYERLKQRIKTIKEVEANVIHKEQEVTLDKVSILETPAIEMLTKTYRKRKPKVVKTNDENI